MAKSKRGDILIDDDNKIVFIDRYNNKHEIVFDDQENHYVFDGILSAYGYINATNAVVMQREPLIDDVDYIIPTVWVDEVGQKLYIYSGVDGDNHAIWSELLGGGGLAPIIMNRDPGESDIEDYGTTWINNVTGTIWMNTESSLHGGNNGVWWRDISFPGRSNQYIRDVVGSMVQDNTEEDISVIYDGDKLNFEVDVSIPITSQSPYVLGIASFDEQSFHVKNGFVSIQDTYPYFISRRYNNYINPVHMFTGVGDDIPDRGDFNDDTYYTDHGWHPPFYVDRKCSYSTVKHLDCDSIRHHHWDSIDEPPDTIPFPRWHGDICIERYWDDGGEEA